MSDEADLADRIRLSAASVAQRLVSEQFAARPRLEAAYGAEGRRKCLEDAHYHLKYLTAALEVGRSALFYEYVQWSRELLEVHSVPSEDLADYLFTLQNILGGEFPQAADRELLGEFLEPAIAELRRQPVATKSHLDASTDCGALAHRFLTGLLEGRRGQAVDAILASVDEGMDVRDVYLRVFQPVQYEVGRLWHRGELSVAQEHFCTAVTQWTMSQLYPHIFAGEKNGCTLVAGCVAGDLHEIGLRMVTDFFELEGWDTYYLGANTPTQAIVETVLREGAHVLALSATMAFHLGPLRRTVQALRQSNQSRRVHVLVGGRPFLIDPTLVESTGADAMARDAGEAIRVANSLLARGI